MPLPNLMIGGEARSRFTRKPIYFHPDDPKNPGYTGDVTGEYLRRDPKTDEPAPQMHVYYPPGTEYGRLNSTIHHEDIHAALDNPGWGEGSPEFVDTRLFDKPFGRRILDVYDRAERSGRPDLELPAYLGAQELGVRPADRARFMREYERQLPASERQLLDRIQASARANVRVNKPDLMLRVQPQ